MNILSYNPGHDGAIAYLKSDHLLVSIEEEKNSNWRHSPISGPESFYNCFIKQPWPSVVTRGVLMLSNK